MKRTFAHFIILICSVAGIVSCTFFSTATQYHNILTKKISLPTDLLIIPGFNQNTNDIEATEYEKQMLIWYDSTTCIPCNISHLKQYEELYEKSEENGFNLVLLVSPANAYYSEFYQLLSSLRLPFPIYIDVNNMFYIDNPFLKENWSHFLLLNKDGFPIFIGDPTSSDKLKQVFKNKLSIN